MTDRVQVYIHVSAQKMFRLRVAGAAEHLLNKDLPSSRCGEHPKKHAQQQSERQKPGSRGRTQGKLITF